MIINFTPDQTLKIIHWLDHGTGSLPIGDVTFESVEDGGFWIRVPNVEGKK